MIDLIIRDTGSSLYKLLKQLNTDGERLTEDELQIIIDFEEEQHRLGNFEKVFPNINNFRHYAQFFEHQRFANLLLYRYLAQLNPKLNEHHMCFLPQPAETGQQQQ